MRIFLGAVASLAIASTAQGQGFNDVVSVEGRLALGYSDRVAGADTFLVGDATLRFAPDFLGRFGVELGTYGRADALDTPHETYGAITYDIGANGRLSFGVPSPAYDKFAVSALEKSFPSIGIDRTSTTRSAATQGAMFANWLPYGVGFENRTDRFSYAVSLHNASNVDTTVASLGGATEIGDTRVSGAIEISWGPSTELAAKLQVAHQFGAVVAGMGYYAPGIVGGSDMVELFADYKPLDRVTLSAVLQVPTDSTIDPTAGLSARYGFNDHGGISVGIASDSGSDAVFNAVLDWTF